MRAPRPEANWAGNYEYQSGELHRPSTVEQLQEIIASAPSVHVLGSRHSFNGVADSAELITLRALPSDVTVDHAQGTVGFAGGLTDDQAVEVGVPSGCGDDLARRRHICKPATAVARLPFVSPEPCVAVMAAPATEMCGSEARLCRATPSGLSAWASSPCLPQLLAEEARGRRVMSAERRLHHPRHRPALTMVSANAVAPIARPVLPHGRPRIGGAR